jgi:succinylarginine dihydrolase
MDNSYRLLDLTVYGRQETWEDSPTCWPQRFQNKQATRTDARPTAQWSRLKAGYSDDLGTGRH